MPEPAEPVRIAVQTERPYEVVIGRGLLGDLVEQLRDTPVVALLHQPSITNTVEAVREELG